MSSRVEKTVAIVRECLSNRSLCGARLNIPVRESVKKEGFCRQPQPQPDFLVTIDLLRYVRMSTEVHFIDLEARKC